VYNDTAAIVVFSKQTLVCKADKGVEAIVVGTEVSLVGVVCRCERKINLCMLIITRKGLAETGVVTFLTLLASKPGIPCDLQDNLKHKLLCFITASLSLGFTTTL